MDRVPILRIKDVLLVSVQVELYDALVQRLQEDILSILSQQPATGLVMDVSSVKILDTFTARTLAHTAQMAKLMGARTLVVGLQPAVALTLTEMGFGSGGFTTALTVDRAVAALNRARASNGVRNGALRNQVRERGR